jgi:membrane protein implicated in regulation of membrane protease activity
MGIWVIIMIAQILLLNHIFSDSDKIHLQYIIYDSLFCNFFQAVCILALWYPVQYYRTILNILPFLLFHLFLLLIVLVVWLGLGFFVTHVLLSHYPFYPDFFLRILPVRIVFGALIYVIFVLVYYLFLSSSEIKTQKEAIEALKIDSTLVPNEKLTRISVKKNREIYFVAIDDIYYIESNGDYVLIHTSKGRFLKDMTMKFFELHLPSDQFIRIHRSYIINLKYLTKLELYEKDTYQLQMKEGNVLKISAAGYKLLKQKMK